LVIAHGTPDTPLSHITLLPGQEVQLCTPVLSIEVISEYKSQFIGFETGSLVQRIFKLICP
jgi:hypothetical protein